MRFGLSRGSLIAAATVVVAACSDLTPVGPAAVTTENEAAAQGGQGRGRVAELFDRTSPEAMALPGTVFADHDERIDKMVFGVEHANAANGLRRSLEARGIAPADFVIEVTEPIRELVTLRDTFRPTQAGIQIHFSRYVCTMGFNVDHGGGRSFITNSHCTTRQGGTEGTTYAQPTRTIDPTVIATEADDPVYTKSAGCPKGKVCRRSDSSRALYSPSVASIRGDILKTTGANNGSLDVAGVFTVTSQDNATTSFVIGTVLNKVGRTTGWTQGPVSRTCVNTNVSGSKVHQLCQTFVDAGVDGGDSGSPVFRITSGDNVELVGILWGGGTGYYVMSPLAAIQAELGALNAVK